MFPRLAPGAAVCRPRCGPSWRDLHCAGRGASGSAILPPMSVLSQLQTLTRPQRHAFVAAFLGWTLDSLDFFLLVFCVKAIAGEFRTQPSAVSGRGVSDTSIPARGRVAFWRAGRPLRPPAGADHEYSRLLGDRAGLRLCAFSERTFGPARSLRRRHGRRVGRGRGARLRDLAQRGPRYLFRHPAGRLCGGLDSGLGCLRAVFCRDSLAWAGAAGDRLARPVHSGRNARAAGVLCAGARARVAGVAGRSPKKNVARSGARRAHVAQAACAFSAHVFVPRGFDDGVHELLARHAGCVSDVSGRGGKALAQRPSG